MSELNIRNAFLSTLLNSTIDNITNDDIAYESKEFDPEGKKFWIDFYYNKSDSQPLGKLSTDTDEDRGFYQIGIYAATEKNVIVDVAVLNTIQSLKQVFYSTSVHSFGGQDVTITGIDEVSGSMDGGWWKRILTIHYLTVSKRV